ncbi:MAG: AbrB/MazE/SpoVT family DNA-binding domain-containing protein [Euryarchaeota archaeon]|nr:AbrB/MazE/SpoVT family DNA-binding domain-containing protein [Euryarchaeota archaeon]
MLSETIISKGYQTVVPAKIRKAHKITPGDVLEWSDTEKGIIVQPRKKRTFQDIIGLIKTEGLPDAVELKKRIQKGEKI